MGLLPGVQPGQRGTILVFLDADTVIENGGIKKILDTYTRSDAVISIPTLPPDEKAL